MNKTLAEKWIENNVDVNELVQTIQGRLTSNSYGLNEEGTKRGMFLETILTDAYTRWTDVELAFSYGLISEEGKKFLYDNEMYDSNFKKVFSIFESDICRLLKEKTNVSGRFTIGWNEPFQENIENYYGICYEEMLAETKAV